MEFWSRLDAIRSGDNSMIEYLNKSYFWKEKYKVKAIIRKEVEVTYFGQERWCLVLDE